MKKSLKFILVIFISLTFLIIKTDAKSYISNLFQAKDEVSVNENLEGTSFIAGNKVDINASIDGIGFLAANELNLNAAQEYLFGISETANIKKDIEKDLFLFASTVNMNANVKRDAYIAGEIINLDGNIERNIYIYGTEVNLNGTFNGNVTVFGTIINIDSNTKILGTLKYNEDATIKGLDDKINTNTYKTNPTELNFKDYITNFISTYIHITLLAIVLVFISENLFKKSLKQTENYNSKNIAILCGKGFLILIGVPIIAMMLLFSGAFISVGIIGGLIYGILVYISNIFTAYFISYTLDKKYFKKNMNSYLLVIIGLFIIKVIEIIPIIGTLISLITLLLGLGIIGNMIIEQKSN